MRERRKPKKAVVSTNLWSMVRTVCEQRVMSIVHGLCGILHATVANDLQNAEAEPEESCFVKNAHKHLMIGPVRSVQDRPLDSLCMMAEKALIRRAMKQVRFCTS